MNDQIKNEEEHSEMNANDYVKSELATIQSTLKLTRLYGSLGVLAIATWMLGIGQGFAYNLQPTEAAKITKGLVMTQIQEAQPQISEYLRTEIPSFIEQIPEMATSQFPEYREGIEANLEDHLNELASTTSKNLDDSLDAYLIEHQDEFKTIILEGQNKEATDEVAISMRDMFYEYLTEPQDDGESIQYKLNEALLALNQVEASVHRLAKAKDLSANEQKMKRALACLFSTVRDNKDAIALPDVGKWQNSVSEVITSSQSLGR